MPATDQLPIPFDLATLYALVMRQRYCDDIQAIADEHEALDMLLDRPRIRIRELEGFDEADSQWKVKTAHYIGGYPIEVTTYAYSSYVTNTRSKREAGAWPYIVQHFAAQCHSVAGVQRVQRMVAEMAAHEMDSPPRPMPAPTPLPSLPLRSYLHPASGTPRHWR